MDQAHAIERDTTAKMVAARLRGEIQQGDLAPGTRLRQNDIAKRFAVSTTPVREAFAQLQAEGLVRIDPHRGAVVFHPSVDDLLEFYEIREALESLAVTHAIPHIDEETGRQLAELIEEMRGARDPGSWLRLNDEFHLRLYACAGRPRLSAIIDNLRDSSAPYIHMFVAGQPPSERANDEHKAILDACVQGNVKAAQAAIRDHLRHASRDLRTHLEQAGTGDG
jgi:DNA-binding GntR family transcriptional regulator